MRSPRAFTLIELLFVVAVIAILAAISVPNFLEAQIRAKVARTRIDMAAVSSALRAYYADHNRYPPNNAEVRAFLEAAAKVDTIDSQTLPTPKEAAYSWTQDDPDANQRSGYLRLQSASKYGDREPFPVLHTAGHDLVALTTPVPYYSGMLPDDVFKRSEARDTFLYLNLADVETTSPTTDSGRLRRFVLLSYGPDQGPMDAAASNPAKGTFLPYDPTNGTVSKGDILEYGDWSPQMRAGEAPKDVEEKPRPGGTMDFGMI